MRTLRNYRWLLPALVLALKTVTAEAALPPATNVEAYQYYHGRSEALYDGNGTWGETLYTYRMSLRDSYWRADMYGVAALATGNVTYRDRALQATGYLVRAQEQGGGAMEVFGFPADTSNPEFGSVVAQVQQSCPACIRNGWVIDMPAGKVDELFYDHGYALATVAKAYLRSGSTNQAFYQSVRRGAEWAYRQNASPNINYSSALAKGLAYAYLVTQDRKYLDKAIALHRDNILPGLDDNGLALDDHNRLLEYHGFIVSGMIALKRALPANDPFHAQLDAKINAACALMATRDLGSSDPAAYGVTWPGTNILAWHELSEYRTLNPTEINARNRVLDLLRNYTANVANEALVYRLRKALYTYSAIGLFAY